MRTKTALRSPIGDDAEVLREEAIHRANRSQIHAAAEERGENFGGRLVRELGIRKRLDDDTALLIGEAPRTRWTHDGLADRSRFASAIQGRP